MERFELWERAMVDTAARWRHLATLLEESRESTRRWSGPLAVLGAIVGDELGARAAAASRWESGMRGLVHDVRGVEAQVVADLSRLARRVLR
ncbi:hypothetical protein [Nocardioides daphniae]|uniref:Uncharacterized protein n=1 Tax=Nocardioides daphniae TaxID=402297 RepID=A0A4P7U8B7_9ACTN|nr:hypothetical protein [Nocardioides daphniae]QCC76392.1 hypothetical protein E2C04_02705 [Nocardioides daphniae]GGD07292.1 hypothetical protein GCM10007231_02490 [Nocardioides daphniae]